MQFIFANIADVPPAPPLRRNVSSSSNNDCCLLLLPLNTFFFFAIYIQVRLVWQVVVVPVRFPHLRLHVHSLWDRVLIENLDHPLDPGMHHLHQHLKYVVLCHACLLQFLASSIQTHSPVTPHRELPQPPITTSSQDPLAKAPEEFPPPPIPKKQRSSSQVCLLSVRYLARIPARVILNANRLCIIK